VHDAADAQKRQELIAALSNSGADIILDKQKKYTEEAIKDVKSKSDRMKYFCNKYGKEVGLSRPGSYCVAIQMYGLQKVNEELGRMYYRKD